MPYAPKPVVHTTAVAVAVICLLFSGPVAGVADDKGCTAATAAADLALLQAAEHSDFGAFRTALDQGGDVNARDTECNTALIWAARSINRGIAGELLSLEVNFAAKNSLGKTALDYAADRQDAEMKAQIEAAIKAFDELTEQLITGGKLNEVMASYNRRTLDPDYENHNFDLYAHVGYDSVRRTAIMLATVGAPAGTDVVPFIEGMIERGATINGEWYSDPLAYASIVGSRLDVLSLALARGNAASADLAKKAAESGSDGFALAAIKLLIAARDPSTPLVPWLEAVVKLPDPKDGVAALRLLVEDDGTVTDVGSALKESSGAELQFLLAHGATVAKDDPLISRILGIDTFGLERGEPTNLDLLELALDRGARADIQVREYGPQPDIIAEMLNDLYTPANAANSIDRVQFRRVLKKLIEAGASFDLHDYSRNWPTPVEQVLFATTHREILKDVLASLDELGATAPSLCHYIGELDLSIIVQLMEFKSSYESGGDAYVCAGKIGREKGGTPKDRRDLYRALADHAIAGREAALDDELSRIESGGGDAESVVALVTPDDQSCALDSSLANRIASAVGRPAPCH